MTAIQISPNRARPAAAADGGGMVDAIGRVLRQIRSQSGVDEQSARDAERHRLGIVTVQVPIERWRD